MPGRRARWSFTGIGIVALLLGIVRLDVVHQWPAGRLRERIPGAIARAEDAQPSDAVAARVGEPGWVAAENRRPGSTAWRISVRGPSHAIEGYADRVSASAGDVVTLYVSTTARWWHIEAYRMGWYGGARGRLLWRSGRVRGRRQADPSLWPGTNMVQARWVPSLTFRVGDRWPPGAYLLKLVAPGAQRYVPLTVTDPSSHDPLVVMDAVTTWQAYNDWGGRNLYWGPFMEVGTRSRVVSFDRLYARGDGASDFLHGELPLISLLEQGGLDATYWTDIDLHQHPELLLRHRALLSLGHDEYWSTAMRHGATVARDHGVNLAFLGANAVFRHIRPGLADQPPGSHHRLARATPPPAGELAARRAVRVQSGARRWRGRPARVVAAGRHRTRHRVKAAEPGRAGVRPGDAELPDPARGRAGAPLPAALPLPRQLLRRDLLHHGKWRRRGRHRHLELDLPDRRGLRRRPQQRHDLRRRAPHHHEPAARVRRGPSGPPAPLPVQPQPLRHAAERSVSTTRALHGDRPAQLAVHHPLHPAAPPPACRSLVAQAPIAEPPNLRSFEAARSVAAGICPLRPCEVFRGGSFLGGR